MSVLMPSLGITSKIKKKCEFDLNRLVELTPLTLYKVQTSLGFFRPLKQCLHDDQVHLINS